MPEKIKGMKKPYTYFVSYGIRAEQGFGWGSCIIQRTTKIKKSNDIDELQKYVEQSVTGERGGIEGITVTNYIYLGRERKIKGGWKKCQK